MAARFLSCRRQCVGKEQMYFVGMQGWRQSHPLAARHPSRQQHLNVVGVNQVCNKPHSTHQNLNLNWSPTLKTGAFGLWGDQLYIRSAGGAPLKTLEEYIQSHSRGWFGLRRDGADPLPLVASRNQGIAAKCSNGCLRCGWVRWGEIVPFRIPAPT